MFTKNRARSFTITIYLRKPRKHAQKIWIDNEVKNTAAKKKKVVEESTQRSINIGQ